MLKTEDLQIQIRPGHDVKNAVDAFYSKNDSQGKARADDIFFLALRKDSEIVGCVRFCVEENTPLLRTMMIDPNYRRQKIGLKLLNHFENYLVQNKIQNTFCIPYSHLENFYGQIGFNKVSDDQMPSFLFERINSYRLKGKSFFCMRRA
jgi:N-acetylglutamate synthase-like GNAT family acetyltransferase